ncbi:sporulation histidine kinase inhibitor Sda [Paenibacillus sp. J31TS4]|uniref:sporulation histidine kinase inhibitor Sda n=1 Tax=Paenibacillus sp. J31TS4 TaxID=2807195 RepID=UPI001BCDAC1C|nr:sporulation histidine kinase inhibitor Sda [Paenibacillus sp. J31TS4]
MPFLSDDMLLETYDKAIELRLDSDFLDLLLEEIHRRNLVLAGENDRVPNDTICNTNETFLLS